MRKKAIAVVAASLLGVALLSSCGDGWDCRQTEGDDYPALEDVAQQVMAEVEHEDLERSSGCEVTTHPNATVYVEVPGWDRRDEAIEFLRDQGYRVTEDGVGRSPDGRYVADVVGPARSRGAGPVAVAFGFARD